jgi:hypothetical protein
MIKMAAVSEVRGDIISSLQGTLAYHLVYETKTYK